MRRRDFPNLRDGLRNGPGAYPSDWMRRPEPDADVWDDELGDALAPMCLGCHVRGLRLDAEGYCHACQGGPHV